MMVVMRAYRTNRDFELRGSSKVDRVLWLCAICVAVFGTLQPASAVAPPGRYRAGAAAVTDFRTGLVWQHPLSAGTSTQAAASDYCAGLALAGQYDWRLPTISELLSIVDRTRREPAIDTSTFPNTPSVAFWTSSARAGADGLVWIVDFDQGSTDVARTESVQHVRCVR